MAYDIRTSGHLPPGFLPASDEDLTAMEKLRTLEVALKDQMGQDWDPVLRLAQLAEEAIQEGDKKTAISALNSVADRVHGKIKAVEIRNDRQNVIVVSDVEEGGSEKRPSESHTGRPRLIS